MGADSKTSTASAVDAAKVEAAVKYLRKYHMEVHLVAALAIGKYLLDEFFGGDIKRYEDRSTDSPSFDAFLRRRELQDFGLSGRTLRNYIRVHATDSEYPGAVGKQLPLGHRILLLGVPTERRIGLAKQAVNQGLSNRALKALVDKESGKDDRAPRSPLSPDKLRKRWDKRASRLVTEARDLPGALQVLRDLRDQVDREIRALKGNAQAGGLRKAG